MKTSTKIHENLSLQNLPNEIWKDISEYKNYQISSLGRIKSLPRAVKSSGISFRTTKEKIIKTFIGSSGYLQTRIQNKNIIVHQLVAITFLNHSPCRFERVVDHINNIKTDNRVENLQIVSNRENSIKDRKGGTSKYVGVYWNFNHAKWRASLRNKGKDIHLGFFDDEKEASEYYQNALKSLKNGKDISKKENNFTSKYKGVYFHSRDNKWVSRIYVKGVAKYLGYFKNEYDAHLAYEKELRNI